MEGDDRRGPGLRFPPPLLPLVAIAGSAWLDRSMPLPITGSDLLWWPGVVTIAVAAILALSSLVQFILCKTHIEPWQPTSRIIQHGLFRWSRNPIYLSFCIATGGSALLLDSWWTLAALPILVLALQTLVIRKEEIYLEAKFGAEYQDYKNSVRRWL